MRSEPWNQDIQANALRLLSVEVTYTAKGQDYTVKLSTLVDSTASLGQTNSMLQQ